MSDNISKISDDFKDFVKLQLENKAQFTVIANLTRSNEELKQKIKHLESMLDKTVPTISVSTSLSTNVKSGDEPEVDICRMEILKLRDKSLIESLTYEDSKKLETFTKVLNAARNIPKIMEVKAKKFSDDDLLMSLESSESKNAE
jgi:hypothetical protein